MFQQYSFHNVQNTFLNVGLIIKESAISNVSNEKSNQYSMELVQWNDITIVMSFKFDVVYESSNYFLF